MNVFFYDRYGVRSNYPPEEFHLKEINGVISFQGDHVFYEIENATSSIREHFIERYFPNNSYYQEINSRKAWLSSAGIDSDFTTSKLDFEYLYKESSDEQINKILMINDIFFIISSIQNRLLETRSLFTLFYKQLHLLKPEHHTKNTITRDSLRLLWISGESTLAIYSHLENLIVKLYSIFDLSVKLLRELKTTYQNFSTYQNLKSKNILYGDKKDIIKNDTGKYRNTILDQTSDILTIINLRHEIIHNGSFEHQSKVFFEESHEHTKKYILSIDTTDGCIDSVKNRKRFYSKDTKINEILPDIYIGIVCKIENTLRAMLADVASN